ncbi:MAG: 30S ribosomal protein THX [Chitinophagaceae bacterium]|nr:30S ribosomal protein THX [Chitinophagaceae bacterium]
MSMGKGDKRTAKGKRFKGSFGKSRPRKKKKNTKSANLPAPETPATQTDHSG